MTQRQTIFKPQNSKRTCQDKITGDIPNGADADRNHCFNKKKTFKTTIRVIKQCDPTKIKRNYLKKASLNIIS